MRATQALFKRFRKLRLTTKDINKGFYKGTGSGAMGRHTKWGGYKIEWWRVRTYVVPTGLEEFKLTPFVTKKVKRVNGEYEDKLGPRSPSLYLTRWKQENGFD